VSNFQYGDVHIMDHVLFRYSQYSIYSREQLSKYFSSFKYCADRISSDPKQGLFYAEEDHTLNVTIFRAMQTDKYCISEQVSCITTVFS